MTEKLHSYPYVQIQCFFSYKNSVFGGSKEFDENPHDHSWYYSVSLVSFQRVLVFWMFYVMHNFMVLKR